MNFVVLGSGGATPTPKPFCQCKVCQRARKGAGRRNHSSAFLTEANFLFDCGEDIKESINRENIKKIDAIFLTHWHPDHAFGLREIAEAYYDFPHKTTRKTIPIYLAKKVFSQLKKNFPTTTYYIKKKLIKPIFLEHRQSEKRKGTTVTAIGFNGKNSDTYGFLIETNKARLFYAPCDTIKLQEKFIPKNIDILVHECGVFSYKLMKTEISFPDMIKRIKKIQPKQAILTHISATELKKHSKKIERIKTILTHIEEIETKNHGKQIEQIERKYKKCNIVLAYDGMKINV